MLDRAEVAVGAGADGLADAADAAASKGHNSLQLTLRLHTAAHEEAEEERAVREQQLPPMDAAEERVERARVELAVATEKCLPSVGGAEPRRA